MTLAAFIGALEAAGVDLDAETVLDTLWLASLDRRLSLHNAPPPSPLPDVRTGMPAQRTTQPPPPGTLAAGNAPPAGTPPAPPPAPVPSPATAAASGQTSVYPRGSPSAGDRTVKASPFAVPIGRALPGRLPLMRSLRPLNQRWPSARHLDLDEERTVEATAQLRMVLPEAISPVFRPGRERWYDAELVLEDDAAIELWAETLREFAQMLRETGAFRLVRSWRLRMPPRGLTGGRAWLENATGARVPSVQLVGSGVRRLVLFATHGSSSRWRDGSYAGVLAPWARDGSVLLLQLMPRERWAQTRLGEPQALVHTTRAGASANQLKVEPLWWLLGPEQEEGGEALLPLPTVPLQAVALDEWARMQMSRGRRCLAYLLDPTPRAVVTEPAPPLASEQDFERAVAQLRRVSPPGFRLAVALCTSVFTIPVARLVQAARLGPGGDLAPLAEVLQSGLVSAHRDDPQAGKLFTSTQYYEFRPEAKRILLRSLRDADAQQLARDLREQVSHHIRQISGSQIKSTQLVPDENGRYDLPEWAQPFAQVASSLVGGTPSPVAADIRVEALQQLHPPKVVGTVLRMAAKREPFIGMPFDTAVTEALRPLVHTDNAGQWRFDPEVAARLIELDERQPLLGASALWVDDVPQGNADAMAQLSLWGLSVRIATSTEEALASFERDGFDLLISDMVRGQDEDAGLKLLNELRSSDNSIPVIVYAGRSLAKRYQRVMAAGALGCTSKLDRLYEFVRQAVRDEPAAPTREVEDHALERARDVIRTLQGRQAAMLMAKLEGRPEELAESLVELNEGLSIGLQLMHAYADAGDSQIAVLRGERLEVVADTANPAPRTQIIPGTGLVGECARRGRLIWAPNVAQVPAYLAANKDTQSELVLPVFDQHEAARVTAVVNIELTERDALSNAQIDWLAALAASLNRLLPVRTPKIFLRFGVEEIEDAGWLVRQLRTQAGVQVETLQPMGQLPTLNANDKLLMAMSEALFNFTEWRTMHWHGALPARLELIALLFKRSSRFTVSQEPVNLRTVSFVQDRERALRDLIGLLGVTVPAPESAPPSQAAERIVSVIYLTNRERLADDKGGEPRYGPRPHDDLAAGRCAVSVPAAHVTGEIETPSLMRLQLAPRPDKHFMLRQTVPLGAGLHQRQGLLSQLLRESKATLLYVHGYNLDFQNAILRAAQLSFDLGMEVVAYCWPSQGTVTGYVADRNSAAASAQHLVTMLQEFSARDEPLHLLADGLGAEVVVKAVMQMPRLPRLKAIAFVSADVDIERFDTATRRLRLAATRVAHYVSARNPVSAIEQLVNGLQRAGSVVRPIAEIDVIDLSEVEAGLTRTEFNSRLLADLRSLFHDGLRPDQRHGLVARSVGDGTLWQMARNAREGRQTAAGRVRPSVFISYVRAYAELADELAERLEEDLDLRWDRNLKAGDDWATLLPQMLDDADGVLAIAGPLTRDSQWARKEVERSIELGKLLIPVVVAPFQEPAALLRLMFANVDESGNVRYLDSSTGRELDKSLDFAAINVLRSLSVDPRPLALELRHTHRADLVLYTNPDELQSRGRRLEGSDFRSLVAQLRDDERLIGLHREGSKASAFQIPSRREFAISRDERGLEACYALDYRLLRHGGV